jgi:Phosphoglycerate dehydrogenase and related dehydrogenases
LFRRAEIISVHTPLTPETKGIINAQAIATMKPGVMIVNCARGGIIHEGDLFEALKSKHVAAAAFDVFEEEPVKADNPIVDVRKFYLYPSHRCADRGGAGKCGRRDR